MNIHFGLKGHYTLDVLGPDGNVRASAAFDNLITNLGLDQLSTGTSLSYCSVGTGTTTPANSDTALAAYLAETPTSVWSGNSFAGSPTFAATYTKTYQFAAGSVVGNIAEVGVGSAAGGTSLFSRARVLDGGGSPTTLSVTSADTLQVTYRVTLVPPTGNIGSGSVSISGTSHTFTSRVYRCANLDLGSILSAGFASLGIADIFPTVTAHPAVDDTSPAYSGGARSSGTAERAAYVAGSRTHEYTITVPIDNANYAGGITYVSIGAGGHRFSVGYLLSPAVMKTSSQVFTLNVRLTWNRV